jgi:folylpolyglutamate synthase/dihydropteroate synthase
MSIKIALDLKIKKNIIKKTLPKIKFEGRIEYIKKGKLRNKINKKEQILLDVCHSKVSAKNLSDYLKTIKIPKYGIWGMTKNKDYDSFINQFKNTFRKIIVIPIERESKSVSSKLLYDIGKKNKFNIEQAKDFEQAIKKITSKDKKIICVFGSLYLCGSVLNKN